MTEKRFVFDQSICHFTDTMTGKVYCGYNLDEVVELLNEQHEENQSLKKENELMEKTLDNISGNLTEYRNEWVDI